MVETWTSISTQNSVNRITDSVLDLVDTWYMMKVGSGLKYAKLPNFVCKVYIWSQIYEGQAGYVKIKHLLLFLYLVFICKIVFNYLSCISF